MFELFVEYDFFELVDVIVLVEVWWFVSWVCNVMV